MPVPETTVRTSHAVSIRAGGYTIGQIQTWAPSQSRGVAPLYEIDAVGVGNPLEQVPATATNLTIQVSRYDLYRAKMEEVWGNPNAYWMLTNQHNPFDVEEKWIRYVGDVGIKWSFPWLDKLGNKTSDVVDKIGEGQIKALNFVGLTDEKIEKIETGTGDFEVEKWWYSGCWFSQIGRNLSAQGDRIVMVNATLNYTKVRPI